MNKHIPCSCGCGEKVLDRIMYPSQIKLQGERRFIAGHQNRGLKHTPEHISKTTHKLEKNGRWKGGRNVDKSGYIMIKKPDHPFCNNSGYVREHRLVMEKIVGRYLDKLEVVHHKNGTKSDNRPENLELLACVADHNRLERVGKKFPRKDGCWSNCIVCGTRFYRSAYFRKHRIPKWCSWKCRYPR